MNGTEIVNQTGFTLSTIVIAMLLVASVEVVIPLHARGRWHRAHLVPNLLLTFFTFATSAVYNVGLVLLLSWLEARGAGVLRWSGLPVWAQAIVAFVWLDFSFYVAHVCMHKMPALWSVHKVHHSDPVLDVTSSIRQHPLEGVIRYAFMAAFACALGVSIPAFAAYRAVSALNGLLEHANVRVPASIDRALSWVTTWFGTHRIHHSRAPRDTDRNYGNIFSWFDRLFGTFATPRPDVECGLDGLDAAEQQTTRGLLVMPFRRATSRAVSPAALTAPAE